MTIKNELPLCVNIEYESLIVLIDQVSGTMHCRTEAQGAAVKQINAGQR